MVQIVTRRWAALLGFASLFNTFAYSQSILPDLPAQQPRWRIEQDGSIYWPVTNGLPHNDHIEMSGQLVSLWVQYEVDSVKRLHLKRTVVFPTFRMKPNDTHSSMMQVVSDEDMPRLYINNKPLRADLINGHFVNGLTETVTGIRQNGIMEIDSRIGYPGGGSRTILQVRRSLFPSTTLPMAIETIVFTNVSNQPVLIDMEHQVREIRIDTSRSFRRPHSFILTTPRDGAQVLQQGDSAVFAVSYQASDIPAEAPMADQPVTSKQLSGEQVTDSQMAGKQVTDVIQEMNARRERVSAFRESLVLKTPDTLLNTAFAFAKIRAAESIFKTKAGYMHSPGGLAYYAAIWANDQAEYVSPFFAWLGDSIANRSAMTAYRLFASYMNDDYKPIPSSIIAEGDGYWNGAGDRGDQAMIAYGAARYALAYGNADSARELWPLIRWCLEYCRRKINADGVVASNSDELEGRFPAGDANLCTSSLCYDALLSAGKLGAVLGQPKSLTDDYLKQATTLRAAIDRFFGARVGGLNTYRYYKGNEVLRSWICIPLTVGIYERKDETIKALFSPQLFTPDGLLTQAGDKTFWDRTTLYALRGILAAGETETALSYLRYYSARRLLGEHVPYPVEAYPEGNQRHLSAESGLYCRIYTEGLFGLRPTGFRTFDCTPRLPQAWPSMELDHIRAFEKDFNISVERSAGDRIKVTVTTSDKREVYVIRSGRTIHVTLP